MQKIGIIGGTFDPVHLGHLIIAEHFTDEMLLNRCFFVPANISPFKTSEDLKSSASNADRIEMLKFAIADNPRFTIDTVELERKGISYTFDTINYFRGIYPNDEIFLLIGEDNIVKFDEWRDWVNILKIVQICIASRGSENNTDYLIEKLTIDRKQPIIIHSPKIDISSSEIRQSVSIGKSIKNLVHPSVEKYINDKGLYKNS
jgi:nicotinate-nucleotide adenylyltransferase